MGIRRAKIKDCEACVELCNVPELLNDSGETPYLKWFKNIAKAGQIFFVYEEKGEIIGFVMGEKLTGPVALMHFISVRKDARDKGIGNELMDFFEKGCKKKRIKYILLYGYAGNNKTVSFFERKGFMKGSMTYEFIKYL